MRSNPYSCPRSRRPWPSIVLSLALLAALPALPAVAAEPEELRARAIELYDHGRYADALPLIEQMDAAGQADGAMLYRLYYCLRQAEDPRAREVLDRARQELEQEVDDSADLLVSFYLANTYRNVGRVTDARLIAEKATARIEAGAIPEPESGMETFRLGKLYADQEREPEAVKWYTRAVTILNAEGGGSASRPYVVWASVYLAERAWNGKDYETAATYLEVIADDDNVAPADLDRLASANCRLGRYAQAKEIWQRAERTNPADANHPRYRWRLAALAEIVGSLPESAPDGRAWEELSKEDLEQRMGEQAGAANTATLQGIAWAGLSDDTLDALMKRSRGKVRKAMKGGRTWDGLSAEEISSLTKGPAETILAALPRDEGPESLPDDEAVLDELSKELAALALQASAEGMRAAELKAAQRAALQETLVAARAIFVTAALEYALRGHSIREVAFFNGYAPLIFHPKRWTLPKVPS